MTAGRILAIGLLIILAAAAGAGGMYFLWGNPKVVQAGSVDLSSYATKAELEKKADKPSGTELATTKWVENSTTEKGGIIRAAIEKAKTDSAAKAKEIVDAAIVELKKDAGGKPAASKKTHPRALFRGQQIWSYCPNAERILEHDSDWDQFESLSPQEFEKYMAVCKSPYTAFKTPVEIMAEAKKATAPVAGGKKDEPPAAAAGSVTTASAEGYPTLLSKEDHDLLASLLEEEAREKASN